MFEKKKTLNLKFYFKEKNHVALCKTKKQNFLISRKKVPLKKSTLKNQNFKNNILLIDRVAIRL